MPLMESTNGTTTPCFVQRGIRMECLSRYWQSTNCFSHSIRSIRFSCLELNCSQQAISFNFSIRNIALSIAFASGKIVAITARRARSAGYRTITTTYLPDVPQVDNVDVCLTKGTDVPDGKLCFCCLGPTPTLFRLLSSQVVQIRAYAASLSLG